MSNEAILLKGWETHIKLGAAFGDCCWKIKSWAFTCSSGLFAYSLTSGKSVIALIAIPLMLFFFLLEAGYRRLQDQAISSSHEIERALNGLLANDSDPFIPNDGISTSLDTPSIRCLLSLCTFKRYLLWAPYLLVCLISILIWIYPVL